MAKELTEVQEKELEELLAKARVAQKIIENYDQETVDRLISAVAWSVANKKTFLELVDMGIEESGLGDPISRQNKRFKIRGVLRDALRAKSVGVIEDLPEKGIKKYAKPVGVIGALIPTTNPDLTPAGQAVYGIKARDVLIFSPHPRSKKTTFKTVELMREALVKLGAPADILQCIQNPSVAMTEALMSKVDLVIATGGKPMVKAAYSSGIPAYGSGAGNATMIFDNTLEGHPERIHEAAYNTMLSKTSDYGSGCSADGNIIIYDKVYDEVLNELEAVGGYRANSEEREALKKVMWDAEGHRLSDTVAIAPQKLAAAAGFTIPEDRKFIFVEGDGIGKEYFFSGEKLTTLLATHKYSGEFENALDVMRAIYEVGGKGHSVGIYSHDDNNIHRLALAAPVSRIMVRQPQSRANSGAATNGMPMTSSMGCGTWGGNIVSENISLKHYMNTTWVSRPIMRDMPADEDLFGEFYDPAMEA